MGPLVVTGLALIGIGLVGVLVRRSLVVGAGGFAVAFLGIAALYVAGSARHAAPEGFARAGLVLIGALLVVAVHAAVAIAAYRQKGTVNVDEMRELRG